MKTYSHNESSAATGEGGSRTAGRWTDEEHDRFVEALRMFGKDWYRVGEYVGTRNASQIRSHAQKFSSKLDKDI